MRILLVEDDPMVATSIELMLRSAGYEVQSVAAGEEGVHLGSRNKYDIILLDLNLPDISGYDVLRALRSSKIDTPILILSGFTGIENKVKGLGFGADDYLTKPFHKDELTARIQAILRRSAAPIESVVRCGDLVINLEEQRALIANSPVALTNKEFKMLELLALRLGGTITKEMFLNHLYGGMDEPEMKIIDVFICKVRRKLADASGGQQFIETVWGRGYALREATSQNIAV